MVKGVQENMTNEEIVERIRAGENVQENMFELWQQNTGMIKQIAIRFTGYAELEDLLQEAFISLYDAVAHYDSDRGAAFLTCATYWIKQRLLRYIENKGRVVRIPSEMQGKIRRYKKARSEYYKYHGCEALDIELKRILGVNEEMLHQIKAFAKMSEIASLDKPIGDEEGEYVLGDLIASDEDLGEDITRKIDHEAIKKDIWARVDSLPSEQRQVIHIRYQGDATKTIKAVGKILELPENVTRNIHSKALRKLRYQIGTSKKEWRSYYETYLAPATSHHVGVSQFNRTWTSEVEREILFKYDH